MATNNRYDTYLLYEYMKKVSFTVRILVKLNENIDPKLLNEAAQEAITRLPYFAVKVRVDETGTKVHNPQGLDENKTIAKRGGQIAGDARKNIEAETGKPVITSQNAMQLNDAVVGLIENIIDIEYENDNENGE